MQFCPSCSNILLIEDGATGMRFFCQTCPFLYPIKKKISQKLQLERKQVDDVLGGDEAWENVDQTQTRCPFCDHDRAYFMQIQIRSADEPSTTFYRCVQCKKRWNDKLKCHSIAFHGIPDGEFGDKVILPSSALAEIQKLEIPMPLLFELRNGTITEAKDIMYNHCGVLEFSAPEGTMYAPYWIMQNLLVEEGTSVIIKNIAASIGPKVLLESTLRRYSVLSVAETIMIEYGGQRYFLDVLQVKPGRVASLYGHLDLEVDFAAPKGQRNVKAATGRPSVEIIPTVKTESETSSAIFSYGRRLRDGGYVSSELKSDSKPQGRRISFKQAQEKIDTREIKTSSGLEMRRPFAVKGQTLMESESSESECRYCLGIAPAENRDLHQIRCERNPTYHKTRCLKCFEKILNRDMEIHVAEKHKTVVCDCGDVIEQLSMDQHKKSVCIEAPETCQLCSVPYPRSKLEKHFTICSSRTELCEICRQYIPITAYEEHSSTCCTVAETICSACNQKNENCSYCTRVFPSLVECTKHMREDCKIAREFITTRVKNPIQGSVRRSNCNRIPSKKRIRRRAAPAGNKLEIQAKGLTRR